MIDLEEEIETQEVDNTLPPVYSEYLKRCESDYLANCKFLDFLSQAGIAATANAANYCTVLLACEIGISWLSSFSLGFGFGLIPAAYYLSKSGIGFRESVTVEDLGDLVKSALCVVGAGGVAWNAAGEKRFLIKFTEEGRNDSAKIIAEYEVKPPDLNNLGIDKLIKAFGSTGNLLVIGLVLLLLWRFVFSRRY
jgi:hypothetical protein